MTTNKTYKVLKNLKHDGRMYVPGETIEGTEGFAELVEVGVLEIIGAVEEAETVAPAAETATDAAEKPAAEATASTETTETATADVTAAKDADTGAAGNTAAPVVGDGDVAPKDPDTGANL